MSKSAARSALAVTEGLLYRRGNVNGTADHGPMAEKNAGIAFSPGFR